jgi:crotonobetainyl-CoA:carnitine CoA-transferase CaiB-like acyl-CoA transferase
MCGRYLADLGADVLRVERPKPDESPDGVDWPSLHKLTHHAGKRVLVLDDTSSAGREQLLGLIGGADIWIESQLPDESAGTELDPEEIYRCRSGLIVASITDFGRSGPYACWKATDAVLTAMIGTLSRSGIPGREPLIPPADIALETAAIQAGWAVLVAYHHGLVTGRGDHLDLSLYELAAQLLDPVFGTVGTAHPRGGMVTTERGRPGDISYPVFPCADGYVRLAILAPRQWHSMRAWLGEPEELQDPALDSISERKARLDELTPHYVALFSAMGKMELAREGQSRGIPIAPVLAPAEVVTSDHFAARGAFIAVDVAPGLAAHIPAGAAEVNGVRAGPRLQASATGPLQLTGWAVRQDEPLDISGDTEARRPLEGLRVLDLGVIVVGADTARLFADQGADVIKVESAAYPDMTRVDEASFVVGHRGSRSIGLNLRSPEGTEIFRRLAALSDLVLSNFKPGTLEKLGLGPDALRAINPNLVVLSSSAFGDTGPWSTWMGYGPLVRVAAGITALWRYPDDPEAICDHVTIYPDHFAARFGAVGALAALIGRRRRRGGGSSVSVSQAEVALMHLSALLAMESVRPGAVMATGNALPDRAPAGLFPCDGDDEWCVIEVCDDSEWDRLRRVVRAPEWAADRSLETISGRLAHRAAVERRLADWTRDRSPVEVADILQTAGVPAGPMFRPIDLQDDRHLVERRFFRTLEQPGLAPLRVENAPFTSSHLPDPDVRPSPLRGEHTREICRELLDMPENEIAELMAAGVLEDRATKLTI